MNVFLMNVESSGCDLASVGVLSARTKPEVIQVDIDRIGTGKSACRQEIKR